MIGYRPMDVVMADEKDFMATHSLATSVVLSVKTLQAKSMYEI